MENIAIFHWLLNLSKCVVELLSVSRAYAKSTSFWIYFLFNITTLKFFKDMYHALLPKSGFWEDTQPKYLGVLHISGKDQLLSKYFTL